MNDLTFQAYVRKELDWKVITGRLEDLYAEVSSGGG